MKWTRIILMTAGVMCAVIAASSSSRRLPCESQPQYFRWGAAFVPAGVYGYDYTCSASAGVCTYYKPDPITEPFSYVPCRTGSFSFVW